MRTIKGTTDNETRVTHIKKSRQEAKPKTPTAEQTDFKIKQDTQDMIGS